MGFCEIFYIATFSGSEVIGSQRVILNEGFFLHPRTLKSTLNKSASHES